MEYVEYTNDDKWKSSLMICYKQVFAAPPWNEDWWTDGLVQNVLDQYAGDNAKIILATEDEQVVGFAWGAYWDSSALSRELQLALPFPPQQIVGYIKDVGVIEKHRTSKVATGLLQKLTAAIRPHCDSNSMLLARTLAQPVPSVVYLWFPKIGFSTIAPYPDNSERAGQVILGATVSGISF